MKIWLDAQLSPTLAEWISGNFDVKCQALRDLGLRDAEDNKIFEEALQKNAIVMTKIQISPILLHRKINLRK